MAGAPTRETRFNTPGQLSFPLRFGKQVETGQFNFSPDELAYIDSHWVHLDHDQATSGSAGVAYTWGGKLKTSADMLMGSGLRNGFANTTHLPSYYQFNAAAEQIFDLGNALGKLELRISMLNLFDHVYQLRDGSGIGVGAPQFGPRRSVLVGMSKSF